MTEKKKFAVILSGSGVFDGSEIHEATLLMLAIKQQGCSYACFAPNIPQHHVVNHYNGEIMNQTRNVLYESARIARGDIKPLHDLNMKDFDAIVFPGGFGAAKNLSDLAFNGTNCSIHEDVIKVVNEAIKQHKTIGAVCIAPAIMAKIIPASTVTIGKDKDTISCIESFGSKHIESSNGEVYVDIKNKLVTSPCYMLDAEITDIYDCSQNTIKEMIKLM